MSQYWLIFEELLESARKFDLKNIGGGVGWERETQRQTKCQCEVENDDLFTPNASKKGKESIIREGKLMMTSACMDKSS